MELFDLNSNLYTFCESCSIKDFFVDSSVKLFVDLVM